MISKEDLKLCAMNIVRCANISPGENIIVRGGLYAHDLLEEIGLQVYKVGGIPEILSLSDEYKDRLYNSGEFDPEKIEQTPTHYQKMIEESDAYIVIEPYKDPQINAKIPRKMLEAIRKRQMPIRNVLYGLKEEYEPGKRWVYAAWPSKEQAKFYEVDYETYEKFVVEGMAVPFKELSKITKQIGKNFENAVKVHIDDEYGTDFWVSIEGREPILDDGLIDEKAIEAGDLGANLPAGEVFYPPVETKGEGTLYCPMTIDRFSNKLIKGLKLEFKDGKLDIDKAEADLNLDEVISSFKYCEKLDKENEVAELRTYNVCELGIGCNPKITKPMGYILLGEKITGSAHLAFGGNNFFGGTSRSQMHWDFVTSAKENITVEYKDGSKKQIMENGKFIY